MASWRIVRHPGCGNGKLELVYENWYTKLRYSLGLLSSDVPDEMVCAWIVDHGEHFEPGDLIHLSSGTILAYGRWRGEV